jgi:putative transposase
MTFDSRHDPTHLNFVTATVIEWKHLFAETAYADIVLNSLDWLRRNDRLMLFAFVLMPSHLHMLIKPQGRAIGDIVQEFGSFTAHELLKQLRTDERRELLQLFYAERRDSRYQHSIWQDIQAKSVYSISFLREKMEYIHNNPIDKQWQLAASRAEYHYSSACFYDHDETPIILVDDIRPWMM